VRSHFSIGVDALGATINSQAPDSRFLSWRGQGPYVKLLAPDAILGVAELMYDITIESKIEAKQ
jgi:hypothetical protein